MIGIHRSSNVRWRITFVAFVASVASIVSSRTALAAGEELEERRMQAEELHEQAIKLESSNPAAALEAFRSSYEGHPSFRVLHSIGRVCLRLGDKDCAARAFEQYLKDGGAEIPAKRRKEVEGELKALTRATASLSIESSISGAFVKIDGSVVGRIPLPHPVRVSAGLHKIVLVADGNVIEKNVQASPTSALSVQIEKGEETPARSAAPVAPTPEETKPTSSPASSARRRSRGRIQR